MDTVKTGTAVPGTHVDFTVFSGKSPKALLPIIRKQTGEDKQVVDYDTVVGNGFIRAFEKNPSLCRKAVFVAHIRPDEVPADAGVLDFVRKGAVGVLLFRSEEQMKAVPRLPGIVPILFRQAAKTGFFSVSF